MSCYNNLNVVKWRFCLASTAATGAEVVEGVGIIVIEFL